MEIRLKLHTQIPMLICRGIQNCGAGRADCGCGPVLAALHLGPADQVQGGTDDPPDDALHGRGGPPRRPHRHHQQRQARHRRQLTLPQVRFTGFTGKRYFTDSFIGLLAVQ